MPRLSLLQYIFLSWYICSLRENAQTSGHYLRDIQRMTSVPPFLNQVFSSLYRVSAAALIASSVLLGYYWILTWTAYLSHPCCALIRRRRIWQIWIPLRQFWKVLPPSTSSVKCLPRKLFVAKQGFNQNFCLSLSVLLSRLFWRLFPPSASFFGSTNKAFFRTKEATNLFFLFPFPVRDIGRRMCMKHHCEHSNLY